MIPFIYNAILDQTPAVSSQTQPLHTPVALVQLTQHSPRQPAGPLSSPCLVVDRAQTHMLVEPQSSSPAVEPPIPGVWPQSSPRLVAFRPVARPTWTRRKRS